MVTPATDRSEWRTGPALNCLYGVESTCRLLLGLFDSLLTRGAVGEIQREDVGTLVCVNANVANYCEFALKTLIASLSGDTVPRALRHDLRRCYDEAERVLLRQRSVHIQELFESLASAPTAAIHIAYRDVDVNSVLPSGESDFSIWRYALFEGGRSVRPIPKHLFAIGRCAQMAAVSITTGVEWSDRRAVVAPDIRVILGGPKTEK